MSRAESVRMMAPLRDHLVQRGGGNFSAATRAYIYLGMVAVGDDVAPFRADIGRILVEEQLVSSLQQQLKAVYDGRPTGTPHPAPVAQGWTQPHIIETVVPEPGNVFDVGFEF